MTALDTSFTESRTDEAELAADHAGTVSIESHVFGPLVVSEDETFVFPDGLLGFPECQRYLLIDGGLSGLYWLQSLDHGALVFLLVDPFVYVEGYSVDLSDTQLTALDPSDATELAVLAIVTLPESREQSATANLQGPIAFNPQRRIGRQVVISDCSYGVRCPVELPRLTDV